MRVLVTGATGFVGSALVEHLSKDCSIVLRGSSRKMPVGVSGVSCEYVLIEDVGKDTDWLHALSQVDTVVHLAARAHVLKESAANPLIEFRQVNVEGALALARQSIENGVKRFIFISSIGVNGAVTSGAPFTELSPPLPHADYAQSKFEAEQALKELVKNSGMELVIIRPPLVYAAHAPGNFSRLLKLVSIGIPMPFGSVNNCRTMVALDNLVDFIITCIKHPAAADEIFLVSDSQSLSIGEIVRLLSQGMGKTAVLLPVPNALIKKAAQFAGKINLYNQLCGSLEVDNSKSSRLLGWSPPLTTQAALVQVGRIYKRASI